MGTVRTKNELRYQFNVSKNKEVFNKCTEGQVMFSDAYVNWLEDAWMKANGTDTGNEKCHIQNVSGLFVLYRTNGVLEVFWNGKEWQQGKDNCPTFTWDKANEYAKVLGCKFTDSE